MAGPFLLALIFVGTSFGMAAAEEKPETTPATEKEVMQDRPSPSTQAEGKTVEPKVTKEAVDAAIEKARRDLDALKKKMASGDDTAIHPRSQKGRMEQYVQRIEQTLDMAVKHKEQGDLDTAMSMAQKASGGLERMQRFEKRGEMRQRPEDRGNRPQRMNPGDTMRQPSEGTNPENSEGGTR